MEAELQSIRSLIARKTGLALRDEDMAQFRKVLSSRMKANHVGNPDDYRLLIETPHRTGDREWNKLVSLLTVGHSYFFRDPDQFRLLRERILPELIAERTESRSLSLWSVGCSTGEEAYSLAVIVQELLPALENWNVRILGTDINGEAIEKAKRGVFGASSVQKVDVEARKHYFTHSGGSWAIAEQFRNMVEFRVENLLDAATALRYRGHSMDIIVCRNVFIYFSRQAVAQAIDTLSGLLTEGGYLVTGHGELLGHSLDLGRLRARVYPESVVYQKTRARRKHPAETEAGLHVMTDAGVRAGTVSSEMGPLSARPSALRAPNLRQPSRAPATPGRAPVPAPERSKADRDRTSALAEMVRRREYRAAVEIGRTVVEDHPEDLDAHYIVAQSYANLGEYEHAERVCRTMISKKVDSPRPYFLLAHISEAQGAYEEAKTLLKKVIYLDPKAVAAYLELSALYDRENDPFRAQKMRRSALEILKSLPPDTVIEPYPDTTAEELVGYCA
ncbi:MAG: CheR family methyltransferase [Thermodesulfobacteriota bacterium]